MGVPAGRTCAAAAGPARAASAHPQLEYTRSKHDGNQARRKIHGAAPIMAFAAERSRARPRDRSSSRRDALEHALTLWATTPARSKAERMAALDAALTRRGVLSADQVLPMDLAVRKRNGSVTGGNTVGEWLLRLVRPRGEAGIDLAARAVEEAARAPQTAALMGQHREKALRNMNVQVTRLGELLRTAQRFMREHGISYELGTRGRGRALEDGTLAVSAPGGTSMSTMATARRYAALLALARRLRGRHQDLQLTERSMQMADEARGRRTSLSAVAPSAPAAASASAGAPAERGRRRNQGQSAAAAATHARHVREHTQLMRTCSDAEEAAKHLGDATAHRMKMISSGIAERVRRLRAAGLDVSM